LILQLPFAGSDKALLMAHEDVVTIFHEFGHAMHSILSAPKYGRLPARAVPGDFVEAPSQNARNWAWDKQSWTARADYRDPSKKIPPKYSAN